LHGNEVHSDFSPQTVVGQKCGLDDRTKNMGKLSCHSETLVGAILTKGLIELGKHCSRNIVFSPELASCFGGKSSDARGHRSAVKVAGERTVEAGAEEPHEGAAGGTSGTLATTGRVSMGRTNGQTKERAHHLLHREEKVKENVREIFVLTSPRASLRAV
jgi:hypothetical protein